MESIVIDLNPKQQEEQKKIQMSRFVEHGNKQRMGLLVFVWLLFLLYVLVCFLKILILLFNEGM